MRYLARQPSSPLSEIVDYLWSLSDAPGHARERIVPSGTIELVINLHYDEFRIYDPAAGRERRFHGAIVSGCYSRAFEIDTRAHALVLGVHFKPGGAARLLGVPPFLVGAFASRRASLDIQAFIYNHTVVDMLSTSLAALADPTRRSILNRLTRGPATVGQLAAPFRISQQAVSKHLACLQRARLVEKRRAGRLQVCALRPEPVKEIADWAVQYRRFWEDRFDCLDAYLQELQMKEKPHDRKT